LNDNREKVEPLFEFDEDFVEILKYCWDRRYDFKIFSPKNLAFLLRILLVYAKHYISSHFVQEKRQIFSLKLGKIWEIVIITSTPGPEV
jgi:hypothetical protein